MSIPNKSGRRGTISVLITFFCLAFALPIQATGDTVFTSNTLSNVVDLAEALDATNLVWTTKGSGQPWFPDPEISHDGIASATSGEVQYFDQAPLQTTVIGPGTLNFWWRASGSYPFQALFRVNGVVQRRFESFTDWREETMYLAEGTNVLEWTAATFLIGPWSVVSAVMWLDQVNYTPGPTPPLIQAPPVSQTLPAATNVTFSVLTDGTPPLSYQWQHDGTNILGATETSLTLQDVQATDVGSYRVIVTNSYGVTNVNATLTVTPSPPAIVVQPTNTRAVAGGNCVFKVVAQGSKPFSYQWQFNDSPIAGATASELVVTSVNTEYIGNYSVVVSNTSGTIVSTNATMILVPSLLIGWGFNSFG
ncbi:MAG TPA: immunoglobulin domain-containing protein, partial [Clostridia bacterium]|nr:immunoglobulin domain-containing protein [Clostridia bacterium]